MDRLWLVVASVNGFLAVACGAFAAHGLKSRVSHEAIILFERAAHYHICHALALIAVAVAADRWRTTSVHASGWAFTIGILIFCGTLYGYALSDMRVKWLVHLTPVGGLSFLAGWALLAISAWRASPNP